ncbi:class I SAM-dependent methyltransferase [Planktomarina temperata]|nr:class I SAM-dependent methyltransferase [Planktomarina temperata]
MTNKWRKIWGNKVCDNENIELSELIKLDGFDSGFTGYSEQEWKDMTADAAMRSNLKSGDTILEVGCGSGAFLYCLDAKYDVRVYGLDYSRSLIDVAKKVIPTAHFTVSDAKSYSYELNFFDKIYSHCVFFYFESYEYAFSVLKKCYSGLKVGGSLCLMDLNDFLTQAEYLAERHTAFGSKEEYNKKYDGLGHLFFDKTRLLRDLAKIGFTNVQFFDHKIANGSERLRFNLVAKK